MEMLNEIVRNSAYFGICLSFLAFGIGTALKKRFSFSFVNPLLISILLVIAFLLAFHVDYESYYDSAKYLSYFLTPATVSLAVPLYQKMELLKKHAAAILIGIFSGVLTSLTSIFLLSLLFGLSHEAYVTLLPKSITTAIGLGIAEELGGYTAITAAVIIITGVLGNVMAEGYCKLLRIRHPIARGLAIGTASHAIGTAKAMELGEVEGAMSSLSIVVAGLCTVIGASVFAGFL